MSMVCGLDLHRGQITFDALGVETGEAWRGRIWQPDRARFRRWLEEELVPRAAGGTVDVAVEGCTGWRYVVEEATAAGVAAHLAEPAETQTARGRKRRAKTDRSDARLLREPLVSGDLPESWIPPEAVLEWRERVRLYKSLVDQRTQWSSGSTPSCTSTAWPFPRGRSAPRRPGPCWPIYGSVRGHRRAGGRAGGGWGGWLGGAGGRRSARAVSPEEHPDCEYRNRRPRSLVFRLRFCTHRLARTPGTVRVQKALA